MVLWFENEHWYGFFRECIMTCSLASGSPPETQVVDRIDSQAQNLWCVSELLFWGFFSLFNVSGMVSDVALVSEDREARRRGKNFMKETSSGTSCITYSCRKTWLDIQNFLRWQFLIYQKQCTSHHAVFSKDSRSSSSPSSFSSCTTKVFFGNKQNDGQ